MAKKPKLTVAPKKSAAKSNKVKPVDLDKESSKASNGKKIYKPTVRLTAHIRKSK